MCVFSAFETTDALTTDERLVLAGHFAGGGSAVITGFNIAEFSHGGGTLLAKHLGIQYNGNASAFVLKGFAGDIIGDGVTWLLQASSKDMLSIIAGSTIVLP